MLWLMLVAQLPKLVALPIQRGLSGGWIPRGVDALVSSHSHGHLLRDLQLVVQVAVVVGVADVSTLLEELVRSALVLAMYWCQSLN